MSVIGGGDRREVAHSLFSICTWRGTFSAHNVRLRMFMINVRRDVSKASLSAPLQHCRSMRMSSFSPVIFFFFRWIIHERGLNCTELTVSYFRTSHLNITGKKEIPQKYIAMFFFVLYVMHVKHLACRQEGKKKRKAKGLMKTWFIFFFFFFSVILVASTRESRPRCCSE